MVGILIRNWTWQLHRSTNLIHGYWIWILKTDHMSHIEFYTSPRRHLSNFHLQAAFKMRYLFSVSNPGILDKTKNWYKPEQVQSPHQSHTQDSGSPAEPCPSEPGPRGTSLYRISAMCVLCCLDILKVIINMVSPPEIGMLVWQTV